jgi:predicted transposase/invertase (TIGR01784 family)
MHEESVDIEIPEILPPSDDGVFKTLLTHPTAKACLRDIIASNIGLSVTEVTVRNTELPISYVREKGELFDVSCEIDGGDLAEVEMQADTMEDDNAANEHKNLRSRVIYNVCDLHSSQEGVGVPYGKLVRTYQITFCGYTVFQERESCFNRFSFRNVEGDELLNAVSILFVELSKLKRVQEKPVSGMTGAEMWAVFLACANKPKYRGLLNEIIGTKGEIKMAYEILTGISRDADERARFRARRKFQMDMEHDRIINFEKGMLEGERKGKLDGILEGERNGRLEVARNLLSNNVSLDIIAKSTGLSLDEIRTLR